MAVLGEVQGSEAALDRLLPMPPFSAQGGGLAVRGAGPGQRGGRVVQMVVRGSSGGPQLLLALAGHLGEVDEGGHQRREPQGKLRNQPKFQCCLAP